MDRNSGSTRAPAAALHHDVASTGDHAFWVERSSKSDERSEARRLQRIFSCVEVLADILTVMFAVCFAYAAYYQLDLGRHMHYPAKLVFGISLAMGILFAFLLHREGAYGHASGLLRVKDTERIIRVSLQAFLLTFAVTFFAGHLFSRWWLTITITLIPLSLILEKHGLYFIVQALHSRGHCRTRVLIYGSGFAGRRVYSVLKRSLKLGLDPVALVDDDANNVGTTVFDMGYARRHSAQVIRGPLSRELINQHGADLIVIASPGMSHKQFCDIVSEAQSSEARVAFVPNGDLTEAWIDYEDVDGVLLASYTTTRDHHFYETTKRAFDLAAASFLLVLLSPFILLLAVLVRLDSEGAALFKQERVGRDGKLFKIYKFRTMRVDVPSYEYSPKEPSDPRLTRVGRFLRRTSLDELPQLLNVLRGDMSLVGPRPEMPFIVAQYNDTHYQRLRVKPGITGLWQLSADRAYLIHENLEYDLYYIRNRNFFLDIAILVHTAAFAMRGI